MRSFSHFDAAHLDPRANRLNAQKLRLCSCLAVLVGLSGCVSEDPPAHPGSPTESSGGASSSTSSGGASSSAATGGASSGDNTGGTQADAKTTLSLATWNLYLGADLSNLVLATTDTALKSRVAETWKAGQATNFPARAQVIAEALASKAPDILALQEVELYRQQEPGDLGASPRAVPAPKPNAEVVLLDFLALLQKELTSRGTPYDVIEAATLVDLEMPYDDGNSAFDIRTSDRNVLLMRRGADLHVVSQDSQSYQNRLSLELLGIPVDLVRGYSQVVMEKAGHRFTLVNTHLETYAPSFLVSFQEAQTKELVARISSLSDPVILVGDFNSSPGGKLSKSYDWLVGGMRDAWTEVHGAEPGYTCCQQGTLTNSTSEATNRIDLVLLRGAVSATELHLLGDGAGQKTPDGLWASDHFGLRAELTLP